MRPILALAIALALLAFVVGMALLFAFLMS